MECIDTDLLICLWISCLSSGCSSIRPSISESLKRSLSKTFVISKYFYTFREKKLFKWRQHNVWGCFGCNYSDLHFRNWFQLNFLIWLGSYNDEELHFVYSIDKHCKNTEFSQFNALNISTKPDTVFWKTVFIWILYYTICTLANNNKESIINP